MAIIESLPVYGVHFYDVKVPSFYLNLNTFAFLASLSGISKHINLPSRFCFAVILWDKLDN